MMESGLNAEQHRALALLATAGRDGATQPLLTAHGFGAAYDRRSGHAPRSSAFAAGEVKRHTRPNGA